MRPERRGARLYLDDPYRREFDAEVVESAVSVGHVNAAIDRALPISSSTISEEEYRGRPERVRTLNVLPPTVEGKVRIVTIAGFDAQARGGTHVHSTGEIGRIRIVKLDNKGKENKRFYWEIVTPSRRR